MSSTSSITSDELLSHPYSHNCNQVKKCESLKRVVYMLTEYHNVNNQTSISLRARNKLIIQSLAHYHHLINDYHHIITKHLSHSNHSKNIQNLNYIHSKIAKCDMNQCESFIIHYKYEHHFIQLQSTDTHRSRVDSFTLHYLRGIHIHFAHGIDSGFRSYFTPNILHSDPKNPSFDQELINQLLLFNFGDRDDIINAMRIATNIHDVNEIIDILNSINAQKHNNVMEQLSSSEFYEDAQMIAIQNQIQKKRKQLISLRGSQRMKHNRFSTNITTSTKTSVTQKTRRPSRKMNKLLPNPATAMLTETQRSNALDTDDVDAHDTFTVLLNKYLVQNGIASDILDAFTEWRVNTNYDSDGIIEDIGIAIQSGNHESNIHQFCRLKNQIKCFNKIKHFVASNAAMDQNNEASPHRESNKLIKVANTAQASEKLNNVKRGSREYVFGQRFYYWPTHKTKAWYLEPKYTSFKAEILNVMDVKVFNFCFTKATQLKKQSNVLRAIRSNKDGHKLGYNLDNNLPLSVSNLLSIIFYTDCDMLSAKFKSTFYKLTRDESDSAQKQRHRVYWNWSKILTETVECYGTPFWFNKIDQLYHNTTFMYYSLFTATFNAPTSMTRYIEVAAMYCDPDGIILEMAQFPKIRPKYFDCSLVSRHGVEHELLFIGGDKSMDITSIRVIKSNEDHQAFIKAMRLFNKVMRATILSKLERCEITESDYIIIERLIHDNNFPKYMTESFRRCCADKKRIRMDCYCLKDKRYYHPYGSWFMRPYHANLLKFEYICRLFPNVLCIESWDTGRITSLYLTELKNILMEMNQMGDGVKLKKIIIHCDPILDVKQLYLQKQKFKQQNWIIRMIEPWKLVLFKMCITV